MKLFNKILKQYNIKHIGSYIHVLYLTMPLFSMGGYLATFLTLYTVSLPVIKSVFPWLTLPVFALVAFIGCVLVVYSFYKFVYHSYMAFQNRQEYSHESLLARDLADIKENSATKKQMEDLTEQIKALTNEVKELKNGN